DAQGARTIRDYLIAPGLSAAGAAHISRVLLLLAAADRAAGRVSQAHRLGPGVELLCLSGELLPGGFRRSEYRLQPHLVARDRRAVLPAVADFAAGPGSAAAARGDGAGGGDRRRLGVPRAVAVCRRRG